MMHALNDLASQVTAGTMKIEEAQVCFLNYSEKNPDATIIYYVSDMIIWDENNAAYLIASKSRSRKRAFIFMGNKHQNSQIKNGLIMVITSLLKIVVASLSEVEVASLYHEAQKIVPLWVPAEGLGHKQPTTPQQTENKTASGIMNGIIKQRRSKVIDTRFY